MHIPENYLSPATCAVMTAAAIPAWGYSIKKVYKEITKDKMPHLPTANYQSVKHHLQHATTFSIICLHFAFSHNSRWHYFNFS